ncbi:uncharacterized protein LOC134469381 [Engraulis encrasicolus]|uniref:uncharacterized protein LOC134469381 n=1 Tax=Engraulis encrasicolus TaxID=184585 RepID=UPI002FD73FCE
MLWLLSHIDPLWASLVGLAIGVYWLRRNIDPKYEEAQARAKTALDSLRMWAQKHHIEHQIDKLQVDFRHKRSEEGHPIFNLAMVTILDDVLKEIMGRMNVEYTPEVLQSMILRNLPPFFSKTRMKILEENMVVDLNHNISDFSTEVFGIFRHFLVQAVTDCMVDQIINVQKNSRKKLTNRVNELAELMIQHEVFIDTMARDEWLLNGSRNRQEEEEDQVYQTPEGREAVYRRMRKALNQKMKDIFKDLNKILGHMKQAHKNCRPVNYYCTELSDPKQEQFQPPSTDFDLDVQALVEEYEIFK